MQVGIFAKTFSRSSVEQTLQAVAAHGIGCVQFNMACAGLEPLPAAIGPDVCERIREASNQMGVAIVAMSGTFNMIHPDIQHRHEGLRRLGVLASACHQLQVPVITLCTGSRDPQNMWRRHPDNDTREAWIDLVHSMREALKAIEDPSLMLGIEPEGANVIDSAQKARRLLDELASPQVRIVLDAANLFHADNLNQMEAVIGEACELLGRDLVIAHAKDVQLNGELQHVAAGTGVLNYDAYVRTLRTVGFDGPLVLHGLDEAQVDECHAFLRVKLGRYAEADRRGNR